MADFRNGTAHWPAVFSLFLGVTSLIAAEFTPISLLTPIARDLGVTEGLAGQTVTAVGLFAVLTSLMLAPLTRSIDRRLVLLALSFLLIVSNVLVAQAPNYSVLLVGRGLLGICVGGFWSMASAVTLQLVPSKDVPRALSIVYAGVSVATILSLPLASWLGGLVGWRTVFLAEAGLGLAALAAQFATVPSLAPQAGSSFANMAALIRVRWVLAGITGCIFSYGGYHVFFTYLRPYLEHDLALGAGTLSVVMLVFGIANCAGTFIAGAVLGRWFGPTMHAIPLALAATAVLLFLNGTASGGIVLAVLWGLIFGFMPVAWSTWIARTLADRAELAGGLSVAAIQFSIGLAAFTGGVTFDNAGMGGIFLIAAAFLLLALLLVRATFTLREKALRGASEPDSQPAPCRCGGHRAKTA
ncbi:MAG: MFS transporter [Desulfovibrionaceae bacterium]|nr:MFS transporter [Desulfovibrionaceae bacterium]